MSTSPGMRRGGRPPAPRNALAGKQLRQALKLLGKTWRKNILDPDHIAQWPEWADNSLPRSATTIDADIRDGVPDERLAAYERCLGLPAGTFGSPDADIHALLRTATTGAAPISFPMLNAWGPNLNKEYQAYNTEEYSNRLLHLIGGAYRIYYSLHNIDQIFRCALHITRGSRHQLSGRGFFMMFGIDNFFDACIFRWHNNIHFMFLSSNRLEMGHFLTVDPLRHHLVARRDPFWLKGQGITDRGLADNMPVSFLFHMQKLPDQRPATAEKLWHQECEALKNKPVIETEDPEYERIRLMMLEPDSLV